MAKLLLWNGFQLVCQAVKQGATTRICSYIMFAFMCKEEI